MRPDRGLGLALRYVGRRLVALIVFLFPIYWLFAISFKTPEEIFASPPVWWPASLQLANYAVLFRTATPGPSGNSLVIAGVSTVVAMLLGTLCAYSIARFRTGGDNFAMWVLSNRMLPPIVIVFPVFLLYVRLGWVDTFIGLILLYTAFNLPYVIWMMRGYIQDIPLELEESALVDGCTRWGVFWKVVLPMARTRHLRHRRLHLRLRLERVPVRAGPDPQRRHHLPGPGHPLFRRPVQLLGQDRRHERARHHPDLHRRGDAAALPRARHLAGRGEGLNRWRA